MSNAPDSWDIRQAKRRVLLREYERLADKMNTETTSEFGMARMIERRAEIRAQLDGAS